MRQRRTWLTQTVYRSPGTSTATRPLPQPTRYVMWHTAWHLTAHVTHSVTSDSCHSKCRVTFLMVCHSFCFLFPTPQVSDRGLTPLPPSPVCTCHNVTIFCHPLFQLCPLDISLCTVSVLTCVLVSFCPCLPPLFFSPSWHIKDISHFDQIYVKSYSHSQWSRHCRWDVIEQIFLSWIIFDMPGFILILK